MVVRIEGRPPGFSSHLIKGTAPVGLLKTQTAIVLNTVNTAPKREQTVFGDPLQLLWKNCIFDLCGVHTFYRRMFTVIVTSTDEERRGRLLKVEEIVDQYFPANCGIGSCP